MSAPPASTTRDSATVANSLDEELLRLLAAGSAWVPAPVFVGTVLIFATAYSTAPRAWLIAWLVGVLGILVLRYFVLTRLPRRTDWTARTRLRIATLLSLINGCLHGASVAFFPYLVEFERFVVFMVLLAFCAGAVSSTVGYRPVFLAYVAPTLTPLAVLWMFNFGGVVEWHHVYVGLLTVLYGSVLVGLAYQAFRLFRESFEIRLQHVDLNQRLTKALDESRIANAAKTRFLAVASHDLRQPVHALALFSSSLSRRKLDERTQEISRHIETAIETLSLQLDALLDISRLDAGIVQSNPTSFDLDRLLERLREQFAPLAEEKGVALTISCPRIVVSTDATLLEQVVRNLLGNAVKYTDAGAISVVVTTEGNRALLVIKDTGHGIPAEAQAHVFEEFYQVDNPGHDRSRGLGLGLAITRRLVELLDLKLTMSSAVGVGTAFTLALECVPARAEIPPSPPSRDVTLERIRALVIDDQTEIREGMRLLLEDLGCDVDIADGADEGLRLAKLARPDVVLCDYRLRGEEDGLTTIMQLRALYPGLPAAVVTGDSAPERLRDAHAAGVRLLHKPVRPDTLAAAIQELAGASLGERHAEQPEQRQQSGSPSDT